MSREGTQTPTEALRAGEIPGIKRVNINPQDFIAGNFAVTILNENRFASMQGRNFKPTLFYSDPIQVIRVVDNDPRNEKGFYYTLYDGHHRLRGAESFQRYLKELEGQREPPPKKYLEYLAMLRERGESELLPKSDYEYVVHVNDITDQLIDDDKYSGQRHFTPAQAIVEVITPTRQHDELTAHRIAALVLTDWNKMFRSDRDGDYSAMAALCYLGIDELHDKPPKATKEYLGNQDVVLVVDQTTERRTAISQGLEDLADIVRQTTQGYDAITLNAFQTVASLDDSPDGIALKQSQTNGLLALPEIQRKITLDSPGASVLTERFSQVSSLFLQVLPQAARDFRENRTFRQAILNPALTYDDLIAFLQPPGEDYIPTPEEDRRLLSTRYALVKSNINMRNVLQIYTPPEKELSILRDLCNTDSIANGAQLAAIIARAKILANRTQDTRLTKSTARQRNEERITEPPAPNTNWTSVTLLDASNIGSLVGTDEPANAESDSGSDATTPAEQFMVFLRRNGASPNDVGLHQVRSELNAILAVDWDSAPFDPVNDGKGKWFIDKLRLRAEKRLKVEDRHRVTLLTDRIMKATFSEMVMSWDTITYSVRDSDGNRGLDAVDNSLSDRLTSLAYETNWWDRSTPDFRLLVANHYALSVKAHLEILRAKNQKGGVSDSDARQLKFYEFLDSKMSEQMVNVRNRIVRTDSYIYPELLQYILYTNPESTARQQAMTYINGNTTSLETAIVILQAFKKETGYATVNELFRGTVLEKH